jgi:hypothetical protein
MYQIEHSSKYPVPSLGCIVKFVPGCAVISIIGKLSRIQVDPRLANLSLAHSGTESSAT